MAKVIVFGGTGYAGGHIAAAATASGHEVTVVARSTPAEPLSGVKYVEADLLGDQALETTGTDYDVAISALSPRGSNKGKILQAVQRLVEAFTNSPTRLGVIGGAGSLKVSEDGPRLIDTGALPEEVVPESQEMISVQEYLKTTAAELDWFYVHPAAGFGAHNPGEATGKYRIGGDVLLTDAQGNSDISGADFAQAVLAEIEQPAHHRAAFSVAY